MSDTEPVSCHNPEEEGQRCVVCHRRVCDNCSSIYQKNKIFCKSCAAAWELVDIAQRVADPLSSDEIFNFRKVSLAFSFCFFLALIYILSSFPFWSVARLEFLSVISLDPVAVVNEHQYWRLITANLFHVNLAHLGLNLFGLLIFGRLLEIQVGRGVLSAWILISLLGCDVASILFLVPNSVGASGIVYGLQTAFIVLTGKTMIVNRLQNRRKTIQSLLGYLLIIILINSIYTDHVNIEGHMGGALAGALSALVYPVSHPFNRADLFRLMLVAALFISLLVFISSGPIFH